ncbi:MAG: hypothetical protein PF487_02960 [Bacteroidales bacterium]|jgi:hypothetical protein|nr:hypothetical protein [Bacteroidales bacterium]
MRKELENKLFDINKLPPEEGLLILPISISRISNSQNAKKCLDFVNHFTKKISRGLVGATFLYTDNLYEKYNQLKNVPKNRSVELVLSHKNEFVKLLRQKTIYAENAFDFVVWMQLLIESDKFGTLLGQVKKFYDKDKLFQKYVKEDIRVSGRRVTKDFIGFILEETLLAYLILNDEVKIPNAYVNGRDKWRILAYPGKVNKSMIYFCQKNIFNYNPKNPYANGQYDLSSNKFYDFSKINLETLN